MKFWTALLATLMLNAPARGETVTADDEHPPEWREGYDWARENAVTDPAACNAGSNDFNDGCRAFAIAPNMKKGAEILETYEFDEQIDNILE